MTSHDSHDQGTRDRILEAAGRLFGEKGFDGATVRDICEAAGANVASVNYHFHGKETLFAEVVERSLKARTEAFPLDGGLDADADPADRLRAFVSAFLRRRFDTTGAGGWGPLISREMRHPRDIVRPIVEKSRRATRALLAEIAAQLLGKGASEEMVERCRASVFGQIFFYFHGHFARSARARGETLTAERIEELADHITRFSVGGVENVKAKGKRCKR